MSLPLVSVIISTYRRPELIATCIDSVLEQTYPNIEIFVIDDNDPSTQYRELTQNIMNNYKKNERVHYLQQPKNLRQSAALNRGIKESRGKYISFLDDDDKLFPTKIESQVTLIEKNNKKDNIGGVYSNYIIDNNIKKTKTTYRKRYDEGNILYPILMEKINIGGSNTLYKREVFMNVGTFNENIKRHVDLDFYCRFFTKYELILDTSTQYLVRIEGIRNNPSGDAYLDVKNTFFKYVDPYIRKTLSPKQYKNVHRHGYFDVSLNYFVRKENNKACNILKKALSYSYLSLPEFIMLIKIIIKNNILKS